MKKLPIVFLILSLLLFCGFKQKEKPYVMLTVGSLTKENTGRIERVFAAGQRINYALIVPDGVKYPGIRMQISKQDDKTSNWGFSIIQSNDFYLPQSDQVYRSYIVIQKPGHYIIQFFYLNNKRYPFVHREFIVQ